MNEVDIVREAHEYIKEWEVSPWDGVPPSGLTEFVQRLTGYTLWFGGEPSIDSATSVEIIGKDGGYIDPGIAGMFYWPNILAYRVVKPAVDRSLRGWVIVTSGDDVARHARCDGLYDGAGLDAWRTWKWEELDGMTVRRLTEEDVR